MSRTLTPCHNNIGPANHGCFYGCFLWFQRRGPLERAAKVLRTLTTLIVKTNLLNLVPKLVKVWSLETSQTQT